MWEKGTVRIPTENDEIIEIRYCAKVYDVGSIYGIEEGRISKLTLTQNGRKVYNYDRGLDLDCQTSEADVALAILLKKYQ